MSDKDRPVPGRLPLDRLPAELRQDWIDWLLRQRARRAARKSPEISDADRFARAMARAVHGRAYHGAAETAELLRARSRRPRG